MPCRTAPRLSSSSSPPASSGTDAAASPLAGGETAPRSGRDPGFAVYVHWPFCQSKCPYCDFNSHVRPGGIDEARFLKAYLAELDHMAALTGPREAASVFFGGGTPSLMSPATADAIVERIARNWTLPESAEITLEANPTSVEAKRFAGFRAAGVNRVSLGVQALDDAALRALGRRHSAQEALDALATARAAFPRLSFDMIYARPGQTVAAWEDELAAALEYAPGHLSLYQLTIEPGTAFADLYRAGKLSIPDEETAGALYETTQALTDAAGLPAYEISNHARPGEECRHNLVYWRMGDYAGVGPGAHGRLTTSGGRRALATVCAPEAWRERVEARGHGLETEATVEPRERADEMLLMGLRLAEGVDLARYAAAGGVLREDRLDWLAGEGLLVREEGRLRATRRGWLLLDSIIAELAG